jgi:hypothetical protein
MIVTWFKLTTMLFYIICPKRLCVFPTSAKGGPDKPNARRREKTSDKHDNERSTPEACTPEEWHSSIQEVGLIILTYMVTLHVCALVDHTHASTHHIYALTYTYASTSTYTYTSTFASTYTYTYTYTHGTRLYPSSDVVT